MDLITDNLTVRSALGLGKIIMLMSYILYSLSDSKKPKSQRPQGTNTLMRQTGDVELGGGALISKALAISA